MAEGNQQPPPAPSTEGIGEDQWRTRHMGPPAAPSAHPHNQQAASAIPAHEDVPPPYLLDRTPVDKSTNSPMETILDYFNTWTAKTETLATNVWFNLNTAPSKTKVAWGKLGLAAKAITEGGFEPLFKRSFPTDPSERLKKTFACYLSTATGPVAGTLYLSNVNVAFCSDRPLSFTAPPARKPGATTRIASVNPVTMKENPPEKYIQIVTVDGHEFWFMGFVNYEKASNHLIELSPISRHRFGRPTLRSPRCRASRLLR
ncbi:unnamed protein product [Spirodela intermedia]|uniref:GRAM domain-containing protein n=1 Tax=Spirodela intermedia TaxID=51605 RepID=A0A7I8IQE3_SPIIN|nr:unnamed protein product [Spirodela intermedia]CAA6660012.1 unnamed protein product [Spirodela intermedia]